MIKALTESLRDLSLEKVIQYLLKSFIFIFPFQLQFILYKSNYLTGQLNPFSAVFIYLGEILLLLIAVSYGFYLLSGKNPEREENKFRSVILILLILWLGFDLVSVFFAKDAVLSWLTIVKDLEVFFLFWILTEGFLRKEEIIKWIVLGGLVQAFIAITQFIFNSSLGLSFLGESNLSPDLAGVAKLDWQGEKYVRGYGTFGHANVLGGYLFSVIASLTLLMKEKAWKYLPILVVLLLGVIVSFSRSAWLATLILGFLLFARSIKMDWKYWAIGGGIILAVIIVFNWSDLIWSRVSDLWNDKAWSDRMMFADFGKNLISQNPLGVGRGNFVLNLGENGGATNLSPWLFQPVHNYFALILSEIGWLGGTVILILWGWMGKMIWKSANRNILAWWIGLIIIAFLDHYLITNWSGQIILVLFFVMAWMELFQNIGITHQENGSG